MRKIYQLIMFRYFHCRKWFYQKFIIPCILWFCRLDNCIISKKKRNDIFSLQTYDEIYVQNVKNRRINSTEIHHESLFYLVGGGWLNNQWPSITHWCITEIRWQECHVLNFKSGFCREVLYVSCCWFSLSKSHTTAQCTQ